MTAHQDFVVDFDAAAGVATIWMQLEGKANKINARFGEGLAAAIDETLALDGLEGIILATGHRDFCVGADLEMIFESRDAEALHGMVSDLHARLRHLETCGKPVVAAITGSALGGGYELALACHHRIALDDSRIMVGLPEVQLGVIPGGGGTQRLPRIIGIQPALEVLAQGKTFRAPKAEAAGLVDALAPNIETLRGMAIDWIKAHPKATQPWDAKRFRWPGGVQPDTPDARNLFAAGAAMLVKKTAGAFKAPEACVQAVYEGSLLQFDAAMAVEARYFVERVISDQAKDMIRTLWFHKSAADKLVGQPRVESDGFETVGILGAGMMGAGLAFVCADRGYNVVLKDIRAEQLEQAMAHCEALVAKRRKHFDAEAKAALLGRIKTTLDVADLSPCDLVIEAVFEDMALKHRVIRETEAVLKPSAIFASNTSALPIGALAEASVRPANFIGLHYFSPVEQMPLLEVITHAGTSDDTLARCLAFGRTTKKTSIVVNDGYGFFTTRVFSAYILEGVALLSEGHAPILIERAAQQAGMVVPPLKVFDEVTLSLGAKALTARAAFSGAELDLPGLDILEAMVAQGRLGKAAKAGFYDYSSKPRRLWAGLAELTPAAPAGSNVASLAERLMLAQVLEAARCLDEGILNRAADGDVGAVFGVGFAPGSGGPFAWMDRFGAAALVQRAEALVAAGHVRFAPPALLKAMAEEGRTFYEA